MTKTPPDYVAAALAEANAQPIANRANLLVDMEAFLTRYVSFTTKDYSFALALWAAATYLWPHFDAFGYLVITSDTKRSGKSRLGEVLQFLSSNPRAFAAMSAAALFRSIRDENPTIFMDEAEAISGEAAGVMRSVLNVGYRKGQTIPRIGKSGIEEWPAYCPKVFILIGDMYDTLRDRSIIVRMRRTKNTAAMMRFTYDAAKSDGNALGEQVRDCLTANKDRVLDYYLSATGLDFLPDRDAEIWLPLFAVCSVLAPDRMSELERVAVDLTTDKTQDIRRYTTLQHAETDAADEEYGERLLRDLHAVMGLHKHLYTADALEKLKAVPTAPWRKFRGDGLTAIDMSNLLSRFAVAPKLVRSGRVGVKTGPNAEKIARGYKRDDVEKAIAGL